MFGAKRAAAEPTVIGQGTAIEGNLRANGRVQIDGHLEGKLEVDGQVSVGPNGSISGEVIADELGDRRARRRQSHRAQAPVRRSQRPVHGELCYGTLQVERGAVIDGRALHGDAAPIAVTDAEVSVQRTHAMAG